MADPLTFRRRGRVTETVAATWRTWFDLTGRYKVVESKIPGLPVRYLAEVRVDLPCCTWDLISRHRKRRAAEAACQAHARGANKTASVK